MPEQLGLGVALTDENVSAKAFELIFAFDEVLAAGGYVEDVSLHQVRTNLEMESHEEKLALMIKASKMAEAKEAAKRRANEIHERTREDERLNRAGLRDSSRAGYGGFSGGSGGGGGGGGGYDSYGGGGGGGGGGRGGDSYDDRGHGGQSAQAPAPAAAAEPAKRAASSGMRLGSKKAPGLGGAASGALAGLIAEEGIRGSEAEEAMAGGALVGAGASAASAVQAARAAAEAASAEQATVVVEERVTARVARDGGLLAFEVKGSLSLTLHDEAAARARVVLRRGDDAAFSYQSECGCAGVRESGGAGGQAGARGSRRARARARG